ncbi:MAG: hypothetical protein BM556_01620 [Bacteriovorax sp. MedPE-SWde]|nr:MAG: hypothetical protein BM556_01620 [Bacteriovorax sp. MedPE-SWde]
MKIIISIAILIVSMTSTHAKFAIDTFSTPCEELTLKIKSCESHTISNRSALHPNIRNRSDIVFVDKGALITSKIIKRRATKCNETHKMNIKKYKQRMLRAKLFVSGLTCRKNMPIVQVIKLNFYCDTPGTATIFSCFVESLGYKKGFNYTILK